MKKRYITLKQHQEETIEPNALFECAELILPWLHPSELASVSSTCKLLNQISKKITGRRSSDASRSFEKFSIPFINTVDDYPYAYFIYSPSQIIRSTQFQRQSWGSSNPRVPLNPGSYCPSRLGLESVSFRCGACEDGCICDCERRSGVEDADLECPCSSLRSAGVMSECGPSCRCDLECRNRTTQGGVSVRVKIVRDRRKGWGLRAAESIARGQFVCEYTGELLTTTEARKQQEMYDALSSHGRFSSALLVVREYLPSRKACLRINIDATRIGNVARFINHCCDGGNLSTILVRSSGALLPRLCFFASRDIEEDEELSFSYGDIRVRSNGLQCFCDSSCCCGILPSEDT